MEKKREAENIKKEICKALEPDELKELRKQLKLKEAEAEALGDWELSEEECDDELDGVYPEVDLAGCKYSFSNVLKSVDEVRYDMFKTDIESNRRTEAEELIQEGIEDLKEQLRQLIGDDEE